MKLSRTVGPGAIGIRLSQLKEATFTTQPHKFLHSVVRLRWPLKHMFY
jgi:hypothetical protein